MITPDNRKARITRPNMASNRQSGCAVVITVNRVQETHQNGFDDSMLTDIYSLDRLYNDERTTHSTSKKLHPWTTALSMWGRSISSCERKPGATNKTA